VTKQVERKKKETMTTIPLCSLNFSSLDFDDSARNFLGGWGGERTLVLDWKKTFFFPLTYFIAIESVPLEKCSNNVTKLATRGS